MSKPKISVIVIYNSQTNLEECLDSLLKQSFSNIEIICINNASKDNAQEIAKVFAQKDDRIKLLNLPIENDVQYAKKAGLGVSDGDFVCFLNCDKPLSVDYIKNLYLETTTKDIEIENDRLYKPSYLENMKDVISVIENQVAEQIKAEVKRQSEVLDAEKEALHKEWDKFYQINNDNIKNNIYELQCRFNQLESLFYEKESEYNKKLYDLADERKINFDNEINKIYGDFSKVYDFIKSEVNLKGAEINEVYDAISKNYGYTEELIESRQKSLYDAVNAVEGPINDRINKLEQEIVSRYVSLKRLMDVQIDELRVKLGALTGDNNSGDVSDVLGRTMSDNIDKIYAQMNNTSSTIYEEISNLYKELNERINQEKEDCRYLTEQKIQELQSDFDKKIELIKKDN